LTSRPCPAYLFNEMDEPPKKEKRDTEEATIDPASPHESLDKAVAPEPAADEAVKKALNVAESVGKQQGDVSGSLGLGFDSIGDSVSLNQIIDQAEQRSRALFERASSAVHDPLEELDVLDIAAQFGRPSESVGSVEEPTGESVNELTDTKDLSPRYTPTQGMVVNDPALHTPKHIKEPIPPPGEPASSDRENIDTNPIAPSRAWGLEKISEMTPQAVDDSADKVSGLSKGSVDDTYPLEALEASDTESFRALVETKISHIRDGTYFDILEIPFGASNDDVKNAHRRLLDRFREEHLRDTAHSDLKKELVLIRAVVNEAYEVLGSPHIRDCYRRAAVDNGD
jgi:hypothetical protein